MAKPKKIALNRWVLPITLESVKSLAEVLECGEGEVLDQAVEFFEAHNGGEARVTVSYPTLANPSIPSAALPAAGNLPAPPTPNRPVRESGYERAQREKRERYDRTAALDSVDDPSIDRSDEYVSQS